MKLQKRRVTKPDGRYIIYYAFDRPLPRVELDQRSGEAKGRSPGPPEEGGREGPGGTGGSR